MKKRKADKGLSSEKIFNLLSQLNNLQYKVNRAIKKFREILEKEYIRMER
jgi:hypothetical protein